MEIQIISPTIQEYAGTRYYLCGNYFQRKGVRLHVKVWRDHKGEIPKGYHVHHKDFNRANNEIDNLELIEKRMHMSLHKKTEKQMEYAKHHIEDIREQAAEWHRSPEGRKWHSEHAKKEWENAGYKTYICTNCGREFTTRHNYADGRNRFCSANCRSTFRRKSGVDDITAYCEQCGRPFHKNKYSDIRYCSIECAVKARWGK